MRPHRCNNNNNNNNTCWLRVLFLAGLTLLLYIQLFVGAIVKELGALSMVDRSSIVNNNNNVKNEMRNNPSSHTPVETFICPVTTETTTPMTATTLSPHGYTPIVVFSDPRTVRHGILSLTLFLGCNYYCLSIEDSVVVGLNLALLFSLVLVDIDICVRKTQYYVLVGIQSPL